MGAVTAFRGISCEHVSEWPASCRAMYCISCHGICWRHSPRLNHVMSSPVARFWIPADHVFVPNTSNHTLAFGALFALSLIACADCNIFHYHPDCCCQQLFGDNLLGLHMCRYVPKYINHLEERLLDQAQARAAYTPLFWGHSRSIPQGMILDVQPLVKSLFCPIRASPNGFFDSEASIP